MRLALKVVPSSSRDRIAGWIGDALKVCVAAPPERGRANEAVLRVLAEALGLPTRSLRLVEGHTSPRKLVEIDGLDESEIRWRFGPSREPTAGVIRR